MEVEEHEDTLLVRRNGPLQKANVKTMPYPGFPTDMQPQITTVLCLAEGTSLVTESIWNNGRYRYVDELKRMGANIQVDDKTAVVEGVDHLTGAPIQACDLRAGAALVIAALAAHGESEISCVQYIERGYEDIVRSSRAWARPSARWSSRVKPRSWRPISAEALRPPAKISKRLMRPRWRMAALVGGLPCGR